MWRPMKRYPRASMGIMTVPVFAGWICVAGVGAASLSVGDKPLQFPIGMDASLEPKFVRSTLADAGGHDYEDFREHERLKVRMDRDGLSCSSVQGDGPVIFIPLRDQRYDFNQLTHVAQDFHNRHDSQTALLLVDDHVPLGIVVHAMDALISGHLQDIFLWDTTGRPSQAVP